MYSTNISATLQSSKNTHVYAIFFRGDHCSLLQRRAKGCTIGCVAIMHLTEDLRFRFTSSMFVSPSWPSHTIILYSGIPDQRFWKLWGKISH